jgi:hypothetical protein
MSKSEVRDVFWCPLGESYVSSIAYVTAYFEMTPQAIRGPAFPAGSVFMSSLRE